MKLGFIYSSFNNYDILEHEVLNRVDFADYPVINIDDHSDEMEQKKGKLICARNGIEYQLNKKKGLQYAVDQGIEYLSNAHGCEWIFCLQQDVFPMRENFLEEFEKTIKNYDVEKIGAIGFNVLDDDIKTKNSYKNFLRSDWAKGSLGIFFLSDSKSDFKRMNLFWYIVITIIGWFGTPKYKDKARRFSNDKRWFSARNFNNFDKYSAQFTGLYSIELPIWAGVAINVECWKAHVTPSEDFIFHLWFNDVAMQWLTANIDLAVASDLYVFNDQRIKEKYGFQRSSANAGRSGDTKHVEQYGQHLINFRKRWGFDYEDPRSSYPGVSERYVGTLVDKYFNHDCRRGPMKVYSSDSGIQT